MLKLTNLFLLDFQVIQRTFNLIENLGSDMRVNLCCFTVFMSK
jgi:hypothetical protein